MRIQTPVTEPDPDLHANADIFALVEEATEHVPVAQPTESGEEEDIEWHWNWVGDGLKQQRRQRTAMRTHYKAVEASMGRKRRTYRIGDTVCLKGEESETWVAQIVDLFEISRKDSQFTTVLGPAREGMRYDLMRCTVRWFYNYADLNKDTYRVCGVPEWIRGEVYFSDHVEQDGYNDVTVIGGRAWLFSSRVERDAFLRSPKKEYDAGMDETRIVRSFVNSKQLLKYMRELEKGELEFLLSNPSSDKNFYEVGPKRLAEAQES